MGAKRKGITVRVVKSVRLEQDEYNHIKLAFGGLRSFFDNYFNQSKKKVKSEKR